MEEVNLPFGAYCLLYKTCKVCGETKPSKEFLRPRKKGRFKSVSYCIGCGQREDFYQVVADAKMRENQMQGTMVAVPINLAFDTSQITSSMVILYSRLADFKDKIPHEAAVKLVQEGAALIEYNNKIRLLFNKKTLRDFVLKRDHNTCYFCGEVGDQVLRLVPKHKGGKRTPKNVVCVCATCRPISTRKQLIRMEQNPNRPAGPHSKLYKCCSICGKFKNRREFTRNSICNSCWSNELLLKKPAEMILPGDISYVEMLNVENIIKFPELTRKSLIEEISIIPSSDYCIQIYLGPYKEYQWRKIDYRLAVSLVDEGFCKVVPYYPNILFTVYSQTYTTFRKQILQRDKYTCRYCGDFGDTLDHILPISRGGLTSPKNCVTACKICNHDKADEVDGWYGWFLTSNELSSH